MVRGLIRCKNRHQHGLIDGVLQLFLVWGKCLRMLLPLSEFLIQTLDYSAALKDEIAPVAVPLSAFEGEGSTQRVLPNSASFKSGFWHDIHVRRTRRRHHRYYYYRCSSGDLLYGETRQPRTMTLMVSTNGGERRV